MKAELALLAVSLLTTPGHAAETAAALRAALVGNWAGALGYRDYQTNTLSELPVVTTIAQAGDGVTQVRTSKFDEGGKRPPVWITTVSIDDTKASTVTSASFRKGRVPELETDKMSVTRYTGPQAWTIVYAQTGEDDDKPAEIRVTETRNGDALLSKKEVRPVGGDDKTWRFRNQTRLQRVK